MVDCVPKWTHRICRTHLLTFIHFNKTNTAKKRPKTHKVSGTTTANNERCTIERLTWYIGCKFMETHTQNGTVIKWRSAYTSLSWAVAEREIKRASKIDAYFHFICRITSFILLRLCAESVSVGISPFAVYEPKRLKRKSNIIIYIYGKEKMWKRTYYTVHEQHFSRTIRVK